MLTDNDKAFFEKWILCRFFFEEYERYEINWLDNEVKRLDEYDTRELYPFTANGKKYYLHEWTQHLFDISETIETTPCLGKLVRLRKAFKDPIEDNGNPEHTIYQKKYNKYTTKMNSRESAVLFVSSHRNTGGPHTIPDESIFYSGYGTFALFEAK